MALPDATALDALKLEDDDDDFQYEEVEVMRCVAPASEVHGQALAEPGMRQHHSSGTLRY